MIAAVWRWLRRRQIRRAVEAHPELSAGRLAELAGCDLEAIFGHVERVGASDQAIITGEDPRPPALRPGCELPFELRIPNPEQVERDWWAAQ